MYTRPFVTSANSSSQLGAREPRRIRTGSMRFVSGFILVKPMTFPFSIHSETIANLWSLTATPRSGTMFGWRRCLHIIASLQKL